MFSSSVYLYGRCVRSDRTDSSLAFFFCLAAFVLCQCAPLPRSAHPSAAHAAARSLPPSLCLPGAPLPAVERRPRRLPNEKIPSLSAAPVERSGADAMQKQRRCAITCEQQMRCCCFARALAAAACGNRNVDLTADAELSRCLSAAVAVAVSPSFPPFPHVYLYRCVL